jgi:D-glycero-D-manno-heptose 1,7-bisphosphate phosphatase
MKRQAKAAAVFLDRDGTILRDVGYLSREEQMEILPRVPEAIRMLAEKGYKIIVVTNQSAVARGRLSEEQLKQIHEAMRARLGRAGATLDGIYYCPHHPSEGIPAYRVSCECRKPNTGMICRASEELGVEPSLSYVVGDQATDMELAARVGATGIWIHDPATAQDDLPGRTTRAVRDLWAAAQWIADNS